MHCKSLCVCLCVSLSLFWFLRLCVLVPQMMPLLVCGCVCVYLCMLHAGVSAHFCAFNNCMFACMHACMHAVHTDMYRHTLQSKDCCQQTPMPVAIRNRVPWQPYRHTHTYFRMHLSCMPICQHRDLQPRDCRIPTWCEHLYAYYLVQSGAFHTTTP